MYLLSFEFPWLYKPRFKSESFDVDPIFSFSTFYRLPWSMFRFNSMRNRWARWSLGIGSILWSLNLRQIRSRTRWSISFARIGRRLRPSAKSQPKMQIVWENEQDRRIPRLLSDLRMRGWREIRISRNPNCRSWNPTNHCQTEKSLNYFVLMKRH